MAIVVEDGIIELMPYNCTLFLIIQSNSVAFESALSRDRVRSVSAETESDQSLPKASQHSTLERFYITLFSTLSHNRTHCVLKRIRPRVDYTVVSFSLFDAHPEIEITLHRLRKARNIVVNNSNSSNSVSSSNNSSPVTNNYDSFEYSTTINFYPQLELAQTYELESDLIQLLPKFHGLVGEDPYKHLKEFHVACSIMRS
ncbi:hypothetical protein CR513_22782, partial [Mucuna pruriens]